MLFNKKTFAILCMLVNFVSFYIHLLTRVPWDKEGVERRIMKFSSTKIAENWDKICGIYFCDFCFPLLFAELTFAILGPNSQK